jgi:hypothetical protein
VYGSVAVGIGGYADGALREFAFRMTAMSINWPAQVCPKEYVTELPAHDPVKFTLPGDSRLVEQYIAEELQGLDPSEVSTIDVIVVEDQGNDDPISYPVEGASYAVPRGNVYVQLRFRKTSEDSTRVSSHTYEFTHNYWHNKVVPTQDGHVVEASSDGDRIHIYPPYSPSAPLAEACIEWAGYTVVEE